MNHDASAIISELRFEHHREPFGIGEARPRLSWIVETEQPGWRQSAYAVELYGSQGELLAETGRIPSDQSVLIDWPFAALDRASECQYGCGSGISTGSTASGASGRL
jgi:hypothetical protein